ncbi:hypothetical protein [Streptomyces sp. NBC_00859]|uniref:hypothetical protein n=1 Tax=Streptomyces sp. NBC_00859 TaxID=2903682 RepID=UPI00386BCF0C|nr:hypothetical protein OG584_20390 [Streptomyces sp. NBC_00859]
MIMRRVRFGAVLVGVVLSLTGFSRHGSHSSHSHTSGGGCSKSHTSSSSTTHHYNDYDHTGYGSSRGSTSGSTNSSSSRTTAPSADGTVLDCAKKGSTHSLVLVQARNGSGSHRYRVSVSFLNARGSTVDTGSAVARVSDTVSEPVKVPMSDPSDVGSVVRCRVDLVQPQS